MIKREDHLKIVDDILKCVSDAFDESVRKMAKEMPTDELQDMIDSLDNGSE